MKKRYILLIIIGVLVLGLIGARLYLPYWVTDYVNGQIAKLDNYTGSVTDIDIHLWRGAYSIHGMNIFKKRGGLKEPFAAADKIDLSIEWKALFKGAVVAEADIRNIDLNFSRSQTGTGESWGDFIDSLSPFDINRLQVHGGKASYINRYASPDVNIAIDNVSLLVTNLQNVNKNDKALPSHLKVNGVSTGRGQLDIVGDINILKDTPDFDIAAKLENAALPAFNNFTSDVLAVDFEAGTISVYSELAAANGRLVGYVKPIATDIEMVDIEQDTNPFNALWQSFVSVFVELFSNHSEDQFAMRIPVEGNINNPDQDLWATFLSIFENAFGRAFSRSADEGIDFREVLKEQGSSRAE
ncbi:MAG: DUF748 domain-containing protein [Alphaproteobacteria bacterium]|nr:DUF748 domain-containing protein [Alphaproteobacteria bacterium]